MYVERRSKVFPCTHPPESLTITAFLEETVAQQPHARHVVLRPQQLEDFTQPETQTSERKSFWNTPV